MKYYCKTCDYNYIIEKNQLIKINENEIMHICNCSLTIFFSLLDGILTIEKLIKKEKYILNTLYDDHVCIDINKNVKKYDIYKKKWEEFKINNVILSSKFNREKKLLNRYVILNIINLENNEDIDINPSFSYLKQ